MITQHRGLSALTLSTTRMAEAVAFYRALGFRLDFGGPEARFTTLWAGPTALNLTTEAHGQPGFWGRAIFHVANVDAFHALAEEAGYAPHAPPRDAPWGERYFHITDPDGHELSFATPLSGPAGQGSGEV